MIGFPKRKTTEQLLDQSAELLGKAFIDAAKTTLDDKKDDLHELIETVLPALSAAIATNLIVAVVKIVIDSLIAKRHASDVQNSLNKLVKASMQTGIDQVRIAAELETGGGSVEQINYRIGRYKDALLSFDHALSVANESEKIMIHFYRAMTSMRIPGGEREGVLHLQRFKEAIGSRLSNIEAQVHSEERLAVIADEKASRVSVPTGYRGVGGGAIGMAEAVKANQKSGLQLEARNHRSKAQELRCRAEQLANAMQCAEVIIRGTTQPN